jgi:ribosome maturation factor RimP
VITHRDDDPNSLRARIARVAESYGLEVFDVQFRRESIGWVLRVMIDRPWTPQAAVETTTPQAAVETTTEGAAPEGAAEEPIRVDECGRVSQDLSAILDVEPELLGGVDQNYTLEVSSPGLDRPLRGEQDYRRFVGRLAKIVTLEPIGGQTAFAGRLAGVDDGVVLLAEGKRTHRVPIARIKRARLEVEF